MVVCVTLSRSLSWVISCTQKTVRTISTQKNSWYWYYTTYVLQSTYIFHMFEQRQWIVIRLTDSNGMLVHARQVDSMPFEHHRMSSPLTGSFAVGENNKKSSLLISINRIHFIERMITHRERKNIKICLQPKFTAKITNIFTVEKHQYYSTDKKNLSVASVCRC